jgi:class 3 adenylate cyclase
MEPIGFHRTLTAIVSADVAGYSRLMEDDETSTVTTLKSYTRRMFEKATRLNPYGTTTIFHG